MSSNRYPTLPRPRSLPLAGCVVIGLCLGVTLLAGMFGVPHEDSAILYSYSHNLASSGTISYYPGGPRAEGATDFGWMVLIAGLQLIGIGNHLATAILNCLAITLVALRLRSISQADDREDLASWINPLAIFCAILYFSAASTSGLWGFSSIAGACLLATIFLSLATGKRDRMLLAASIGFLLLRPDSIAYWLALNLLFAAVPACIQRRQPWPRRLREAMRAVASSLSTRQIWLPFTILIGYWIARTIYFQDLLPLPFYIKAEAAGSPLQLLSRFISEVNATRITRLTLLLLSLATLAYSYLLTTKRSGPSSADQHGSDRQETRHKIAVALTVTAGFFVAQSAILSRFALIQNIGDRFHVPALAITASLIALIQYQLNQPSTPELRNNRLTTAAYISTALIGCIGIYGIRFIPLEYKLLATERKANSIIRIAKSLREINRRQGINSLYVTEAGWLTYYSKVPTVDTWGLNTPAYARRPLVDPDKVLSDRPDLIFIHSPGFVPPQDSLAELRRPRPSNCTRVSGCTWGDMVNTIYIAAESMHYEQYVVPQRQARFLFMVNPAARGHAAIVDSLLKEGAIRVDRSSVHRALDGNSANPEQPQ